MRVMLLGTTSGAGKSVLASIVCRHLRRQGIRAAPFKTLNMSRNSYVLPDGREMGVAQALQAWACGLEPDPRMNTILLKPCGPGCVKDYLRGVPYKAPWWEGREPMMRAAMEDFRSLEAESEAMVLEGSGSPVELNLRGQDIANLRTARETRSPVVLVGDISRGGVFAGLLGTYALMDEDDRMMVKGFVINRFLGDPSVLASGIERLEEETGLPCLGVMPLLELSLPEEDSGARGSRLSDSAKGPWLRDIDKLTDAAEEHLDMARLMAIMRGEC